MKKWAVSLRQELFHEIVKSASATEVDLLLYTL